MSTLIKFKGIALSIIFAFILTNNVYSFQDTLRLQSQFKEKQGKKRFSAISSNLNLIGITIRKHREIRNFLDITQAQRYENRMRDLEGAFGVDRLIEIFIVPSLLKMGGVPDHSAIVDKVLYIDKEFFESLSAEQQKKYVTHGLSKLIQLIIYGYDKFVPYNNNKEKRKIDGENLKALIARLKKVEDDISYEKRKQALESFVSWLDKGGQDAIELQVLIYMNAPPAPLQLFSKAKEQNEALRLKEVNIFSFLSIDVDGSSFPIPYGLTQAVQTASGKNIMIDSYGDFVVLNSEYNLINYYSQADFAKIKKGYKFSCQVLPDGGIVRYCNTHDEPIEFFNTEGKKEEFTDGTFKTYKTRRNRVIKSEVKYVTLVSKKGDFIIRISPQHQSFIVYDVMGKKTMYHDFDQYNKIVSKNSDMYTADLNQEGNIVVISTDFRGAIWDKNGKMLTELDEVPSKKKLITGGLNLGKIHISNEGHILIEKDSHLLIWNKEGKFVTALDEGYVHSILENGDVVTLVGNSLNFYSAEKEYRDHITWGNPEGSRFSFKNTFGTLDLNNHTINFYKTGDIELDVENFDMPEDIRAHVDRKTQIFCENDLVFLFSENRIMLLRKIDNQLKLIDSFSLVSKDGYNFEIADPELKPVIKNGKIVEFLLKIKQYTDREIKMAIIPFETQQMKNYNDRIVRPVGAFLSIKQRRELELIQSSN